MNNLSDRDRELVAIGAAIASNCIPCIEYHVPAARKAGLDDAEIKEAVSLADKVKRVPARKVLDTATSLLKDEQAEGPVTENEAAACG
jgi:4-carboxymuconolactone decarboxylase